MSTFQTFFKDHMGVDLYMEPNFEDYSCQVKEIQESCTSCYAKAKSLSYARFYPYLQPNATEEALSNNNVARCSSTLGCHPHLSTPTRP